MTFLEGSAPALPKIFGASGVVWRVGLLPDRKFSAHQEMRPPISSACFSRLRLVDTDFSRWTNGRKNFGIKHRTLNSAPRTRFLVRPLRRRMNSALRKFRHQPLAKASGMDRKIVRGSVLQLFLHPAFSTPHRLCVSLHAKFTLSLSGKHQGPLGSA